MIHFGQAQSDNDPSQVDHFRFGGALCGSFQKRKIQTVWVLETRRQLDNGQDESQNGFSRGRPHTMRQIVLLIHGKHVKRYYNSYIFHTSECIR